jgi:hypothetical protein
MLLFENFVAGCRVDPGKTQWTGKNSDLELYQIATNKSKKSVVPRDNLPVLVSIGLLGHEILN